MANANLCMFVYAHTYILGLTNEKYAMHTYVRSLRLRANLTRTERDTESQTDGRMAITCAPRPPRIVLWYDYKAQGSVLYLFSLKGGSLQKQDHSLQSSV